LLAILGLILDNICSKFCNIIQRLKNKINRFKAKRDRLI
jgi:hypothetical protein